MDDFFHWFYKYAGAHEADGVIGRPSAPQSSTIQNSFMMVCCSGRAIRKACECVPRRGADFVFANGSSRSKLFSVLVERAKGSLEQEGRTPGTAGLADLKRRVQGPGLMSLKN